MADILLGWDKAGVEDVDCVHPYMASDPTS